MIEMIKDRTIERAFQRYFDGAAAPNVDLSAVKAEFRASVKRRQKIRRRLRWQVPAFAAALLVAVILGFNFLPSLFIKHYFIAEASAETVSYTELKEYYGGHFDKFGNFALADNASADYTLYSVNGERVLLGAELRLVSDFTKLRANVYIDLSNGKYFADDFEGYADLGKRGGSYVYEWEYLNGEYVCRAYAERNETRYYVDYTAQDDESFFEFMKKLLP